MQNQQKLSVISVTNDYSPDSMKFHDICLTICDTPDQYHASTTDIKGPWTPKLTYHFPKRAQSSENFDSNVDTQCFVNMEKLTSNRRSMKMTQKIRRHDSPR